MHHFAEAIATTAGTVLVHSGIAALVFRLTGLPIYLDIIDLYVAAALIVGKGDSNSAGSIGSGGVVLHTGSQGPGLDCAAIDAQTDGLLPRRTARANNNGIAAAARTAAA